MELLNLVIWAVLPLALLFIINRQRKNPKTSDSKNFEYRKKKHLFTPAERSFLGVLEKATCSDHRVFGKVRIADIITPKNTTNRSLWQSAFNRISAKHFDYVICTRDTLSTIAVVELDDSSHSSKKTIERDRVVENACKSAEVQLIRFEAKKSYQISEVKSRIRSALSR